MSAPLAAQGFFQQLFGFSPPPAPAPQQSPSLMTPGGRPYGFPNYSPAPRRQHDDDDDRPSGKFKTVCVRMCDGFYFPISNSTSRKGFYRDQMRCRSACGDDARLFHLPASATDIAEATDPNGRIYGLLSVAYRYRKAITPGCQCRPAPWSEAERARHEQYAAMDADKQVQLKAEIAAKAAAEPTIGEKADSVANAVVAAAEQQPVASDQAKPSKVAAIKSAPKASPIRRQPTLQIAAASKPKHPPGVAMGLGLGQAAYSWPGDAPQRR